MTHLIETLKKMYEDADYVNVDEKRIKKYLDDQLITAEECAYIIGENADE